MVGVRKASQLEFIYTTKVTEYVQTEVMTSAGITQNAVSHMGRKCKHHAGTDEPSVSPYETAKPLVLSISYQLPPLAKGRPD